MNRTSIVGPASTDNKEEVFMSGVNGTGAAIGRWSAVCWGTTQSDGRTIMLPAGAATTNNFIGFAGVLQDTLGTAVYTSRIQRYGISTLGVSGHASVVPGAHLGLVNGTGFATAFTAGQFDNTMLYAQSRRIECLQTLTAGQGFAGIKVFIDF